MIDLITKEILLSVLQHSNNKSCNLSTPLANTFEGKPNKIQGERSERKEGKEERGDRRGGKRWKEERGEGRWKRGGEMNKREGRWRGKREMEGGRRERGENWEKGDGRREERGENREKGDGRRGKGEERENELRGIAERRGGRYGVG